MSGITVISSGVPAQSVSQQADEKAETTPAESASTQEALEKDETLEESEASEVTEDVDSSKDGDEQEDQSAQSKDKPKKSGFQKRIEKLNRRVSDKEREVEYWREIALKANTQEKQSKPSEVKAEATGKPKSDDFNTHEEYLEAVAEWKAEQKIEAKLKEREEKAKANEVKDSYTKRVEKYQKNVSEFKQKHDDFDDIIESVEDIAMPIAIQEAILDSENNAELAYELAKNREEYERICKLHPLAAVRELGKFEAKLEKKSAPVQEIKKTKAPAPIAPVGSSPSGSKRRSIYDPNLSQAEYEELRREQMRKRA